MKAAQLEKDSEVDRLIDRRHVEAMTGLSRSTIYKMMSEGRFPRPIRVGIRAVRWKTSVVTLWIAQLPELLRSSFASVAAIVFKGIHNGIGKYTTSPTGQQ